MTTTALQRPALALLALAFALSTAFAATPPASAPLAETPQDRWNLADLYRSQADFDTDATKLAAQLTQFGACKGQLGSGARLKTCLDLHADLRKRLSTLGVYASQYFDQDTGDSVGSQLNQRASLLGQQYGEAVAFLQPEILALGPKKIKAMLAATKGLDLYRFQLDSMLRAAPHTLNGASEQLVAQFGLATGSAGEIYQTLASAEMPWPTVTLADGSTVKLDQAAYTQYRELGNRADRKLVFDAFWGKWKEFERTFGETLYGQLKSDAAHARVRHYDGTRSAHLDADNLPPAVYQTLTAQTNANLPTLHRYFKLRAHARRA